ncbi:unnamed protein product [Cuscuta campestris]|uniref:DUF4216 domain-containing protein n=1 Tax=Cuscuta campestris TaxID=132261 RepID=A0A484N3L2_9ASTE|nr:unnamed protein product [Cuscuta campestris]
MNMVIDAMGPSFNPNVPVEEEPNASDKNFFDMLKPADTDLWKGCTKMSQLSMVARLLNIKAEHNLSESKPFRECTLKAYDVVHCRKYVDSLRDSNPDITDEALLLQMEESFASWFEKHAWEIVDTPQVIRDVSRGPLPVVSTYPICYVNGYRFHIETHGAKRATFNSGVSIVGEHCSYYGRVEEIIEVEYPALPIKRCVVFKCKWYDPRPRVGTRVHDKYDLVEVLKSGIFRKYEPFILATQAKQVAYVEYPGVASRAKGEWLAVCDVKPRGWVETTSDTQKLKSTDDFAY